MTREIFINLFVEQGQVAKVESTGQVTFDDLIGKSPDQLLHPLPLSDSYELVLFTPTEDEEVIAAVRSKSEGDGYLVYYLEGAPITLSPSAAVIAVRPSRAMPIVSPGLVALLGYTPWELGESDILQLLSTAEPDKSHTCNLIDRSGRSHELVFTPLSALADGLDVLVVPSPPEQDCDLGTSLQRWSGRQVEGPDEELSHFLREMSLTQGAILKRTAHGYRVWASRRLDVGQEDLEIGGLLDGCLDQGPIWLDMEAGESVGTDNMLVQPFGWNSAYVLLLVSAGNASRVERRAEALSTLLAMRLEMWERGEIYAEYEDRKDLLTEAEALIMDRGIDYFEDLGEALAVVADSIGAELLAITGESPDAGVLAAGGPMASADPDAMQSVLEDESVDVRVERAAVSGGISLSAVYRSNSRAFTGIVESLARLLARLCVQKGPGPPEEDLLSRLPMVLVDEESGVQWVGGTDRMQYCYHHYGRSEPCEDCPLAHAREATDSPDGSPVLLERERELEIVVPADGRALVMWIPSGERPAPSADESLPPGETSAAEAVLPPPQPAPGTGAVDLRKNAAVYRPDGTIRRWSTRLEELTGIPERSAVGQDAGRLLQKLPSVYVQRQLQLCMKEAQAVPEGVEFDTGDRCFNSRMSIDPAGEIRHTISEVPSSVAAISVRATAPGLFCASGDPLDLASIVAETCEKLGWDFDLAPDLSEAGQSWLSRTAASEIVESLLVTMEDVCPQRWLGLDSAIIEGSRAIGRSRRGAILPGLYGGIELRVPAVLLPEQKQLLVDLDDEISRLGGWVTRSEDRESTVIGLPSAVQPGCDRLRVLVYSPSDRSFVSQCIEVISRTSDEVVEATEAPELASGQTSASLVVLRPPPGEHRFFSTLAARSPAQPLLLATGSRLGSTPVLSGPRRHLRIPCSDDELFTMTRRLLRA